MARKGRVVGEWLYLQMCDAVDCAAIFHMQTQLRRSVDSALHDQLGAEERELYARRLLRKAWLRIGEIVLDGAPSLDNLQALRPP